MVCLDPSDMELIKIDIEGEGTFVLECNSGQEIVATFHRVAQHVVSHASAGASAGASADPLSGGAGAAKTKVYSATVAVVRSKRAVAASTWLLTHLSLLQDPTGRLPREVILVPFTNTLDVLEDLSRPDQPLVRWRYDHIKQVCHVYTLFLQYVCSCALFIADGSMVLLQM
jgi:hypothetical protein